MANPYINSLQNTKSNGGGTPSYSGSNPFIKSLQPTATPKPTVTPTNKNTFQVAPDQLFKSGQQFVGDIFGKIGGAYNSFNQGLKDSEKKYDKFVEEKTKPLANWFDTNLKPHINKALWEIDHVGDDSAMPLSELMKSALRDFHPFGAPAYAPAEKDTKPTKNNPGGKSINTLVDEYKKRQETDWFQRFDKDVGYAITGLLNGASGGLLDKAAGGALSQDAPKTLDQKIVNGTFNVLGSVYTINKIGGIFSKLATGNATIGGYLSAHPKFAKWALPLLKNVVGMDVYGQLSAEEGERLSQLAQDTLTGMLFTPLGFIGKARYSVPASFGVGFGLAKLQGATDEDAFIMGGILAALDSSGRIKQALFESRIRNGAINLTPNEARGIVVGSNLEGTQLGRTIMKASLEAEAAGKNLEIIGTAVSKSKTAKLFGARTPEGLDIRVNLVEKPAEIGEYPPVRTEEVKPNVKTEKPPAKEGEVVSEPPKSEFREIEQVKEIENARKLVRIKEEGKYRSELDKKATQDLYDDPLKYRDEYIEKFGNVVNPDLARKLRPEYNGLNSSDVNNFGVGVKNIVFKHLLDTRQNWGNNNVLWTGGSPGSGKSTSLGGLSEGEREQYVAIVDTTFSPNSSVREMKNVLKQGYGVQLKYTLSNPIDAWKRVINRAAHPKDSEGNENPDYQRIVSEEYFIKALLEGRDNAVEAYDKLHTNPKAKIEFYKNLGKKEEFQQTDVDFVRNYQYNVEKIRKEVYETTDRLFKEGKISKELYEGFKSDRLKEVGGGIQEVSGVSRSGQKATDKAATPQVKYDYQSTQVNLPSPIAGKIATFGKNIPEDSLYINEKEGQHGLEKEPHVTVLYGLDNKIKVGQVKELLKDTPPITVRFGETSLFNNEKYDVLKVDVYSEQLSAIHNKLKESLDTPGLTFDEYKPHATIAYLKKGEGQRFSGDTFLQGQEITLKSLMFSKNNGEQIEIPLTGKTEKELTLRPSRAEDSDEVIREAALAGLPEGVLKQNRQGEVSYQKPSITRTDLKTIVQNSPEFKKNPVLTVDKDKALTFDGEKIHFKISAESLQLNADRLRKGDKIRVDIPSLSGTREPQMRVFSGENVYASTGAQPIGKFERVAPKEKIDNFKLFEETKSLVRKYAERVGEKYLPKGALGAYHLETRNIRTSGMNNFSVNTHEIAHAIDDKYGLSKQIYKIVGTTEKGRPLYDPKTKAMRKQMTDLFVKFYPGASRKKRLRTRMVEGYATLVQKYIEMPSTITAEFPNLYREFLTPEGKYYNPVVGEYIRDAQDVVMKYQGLDDLDKVGARVVNEALKTDKSFLNFFDKLRAFAEDEIWTVEKVGKMAGTQWSGDDPSLWLRQYSRGGGVYANNILDPKKGYWSLNDSGDFVKKHDFNWKNLIDMLDKNKNWDSFGYYLVARDQTYEWKELDELKAKAAELAAAVEEVGEVAAKEQINEESGKSLWQEFTEAVKEWKDQQKYLQNNGFLREEVESAYNGNIERFTQEEKMYDTLVREDLNLLHNPQVGIVNPEKYAKLTAKQGYASMKRQFFDDILGDAKEAYVGAGGKLAPKISSLKKRTGGEEMIINPVLNGMVNHIEITKKSLKQIVYNKIGQIAQKGTVPELFQVIQVRSYKDDTGRIIFPQEKDENIVMARINYKRTPVLTDKLVKSTVDNVLSYQNMNIFEHLLVTSSRIFTVGTTGAYAPFSLVNFPADQWNAVLNTRNNYTPVLDQLKLLGRAVTGKGGEVARYWQEWSIMGGDRMTLFQAQMQTTDEAVKYITRESRGLSKVLDLLDKGVDLASIPAKYSETASRFSEYVRARKSGKSQVVALEEAGRVTTPFHHIGSWKFGDKASAKFLVRSVPFGNASLQVLAQAIRTAETPKGRRRLYLILLAALAAYLSSMAMVALYGTDDQKEQYKDLRPSDLASFLHYPSLTGEGLTRVRISQTFTTIGTVASMIMAQNLLGAKYSANDYKQALTEWLPRQVNILSPVEMFFSLLNPLIKTPIEVMANFKDYPKISPIENQGMQNKEPKDRYNEGTSAFAKALGQQFNVSPLKTDYLIQGLFGRATGYLTGKPRIYDPSANIQREYFFTLGRRVENFYENKEKIEQRRKSFRDKWEGQENIPDEVYNQAVEYKTQVDAYKEVADLLKEYRQIPDNDKERLKRAREIIIPKLEALPMP